MAPMLSPLNNSRKSYLAIFLLLISITNISLASTNKNYVWNIPWETSLFLGRKQEINTITSVLKKDGSITIYGVNGIGKSRLATQYASSKRNEYAIIWKFDDYFDIDEQFLKLAKAINQSLPNNLLNNSLSVKFKDEMIDKVKNFLRTTDLNWLLIFDKIEDFNKVANYVPYHHTNSHGHIIFISQKAPIIQTPKIHLRKLNFDNLKKLLLTMTGENDNHYASLLIAEHEIFNTLDIITIASRINNNPVYTIKKYYDISKNNEITSNINVIETIEQIKKQSPYTFDLLKLIALAAPSAMSEDLLFAWFAEYGYTKEQFYEAIQQLNSYLYCLKNQTDKTFSLSLHPKYQEIVRNNMSDEEKRTVLGRSLTGSIAFINQEQQVLLDQKFVSILNHIWSTIDYANKISFWPDNLLHLELNMLDYFLNEKCDREKSAYIVDNLHNAFHLRKDIPIILRTKYLTEIALFHYFIGDVKLSIKKQNAAIHLLQDADLNNADILKEYLIANIYLHKYLLDLSNLVKANKLHKKLKNLIFNPNTAKLLTETTMLYLKARFYETTSYKNGMEGDYNAALESIEESLRYEKIIHNKTKCHEFPYYACAHIFTKKYFYLSILDEKANTYDELKLIYEKALKQADFKKTKSIGGLLITLGESMGLAGMPHEAEEAINQGLQILTDWYGNRYNKNIVHARTLLGDLYYRYNNHLKAQKEYLTALALHNKCSVTWNTDYISRLLYKLMLNSLKLNDVFMAKKVVSTHNKLFGQTHERSIAMHDKIKSLE